MKLVFTGIQGSWKGTQARKLAEAYWYEIVEMWQELRKVIDSWTDLWKSLQEVMDKWFMVSDELWAEVMKQAIHRYKNTDKVIFDGFIRTQWNKEIFDSLLPSYKVVLFQLSEQKAKMRLLWRMYNPKTWETFPAHVTVDPKTWDQLIHRSDDTETSILQRINEYTTQAIPIVEEQKKEHKVIEIHADQDPDAVFYELTQKLWLNT